MFHTQHSSSATIQTSIHSYVTLSLSAGSNRSFTAYIFKRLDPLGKSFKGSQDALLSSLLTAPRLLQTSLPRLLRRRNPKPSYASVAETPQSAKSKQKIAPHGRVALADTMPQLRTAVAECTGAADQEAAQESMGPSGSALLPYPRGEPTPAQDPAEAAKGLPHSTAERGHGQTAPPAAGHTAATRSTKDQAAKKNPSRRRKNGKPADQTSLHEAECEGNIQLGPRSPCAELSNKAVPHSSSDELLSGASSICAAAAEMLPECTANPDSPQRFQIFRTEPSLHGTDASMRHHRQGRCLRDLMAVLFVLR